MLKTEAIAYYKGVPALAAALRISDTAVYQWPDLVPPATAMELEEITNGGLSVNPKVYIKDARRKRKEARVRRVAQINS
jgi:hypothetical protein